MTKRIGIVGGSFDPIHMGHLLIAEFARETLQLDKVVFVPAAHSPLKSDTPAADDKQRVEMLQLAINANPAFEVDRRELEREGKSYTVTTLQDFKHDHPGAELCFVMGGDSLSTFDQWREPDRICQLAFVAVLQRGGWENVDRKLLLPHLPVEEQADVEAHFIQAPQIEISSTEIRKRIAERRSVRYQLPAAVAAYIDAQGLYVDPDAKATS